ncbi:MAG: 4-hydroxy-tetrahydrodipicolinate synthase [Lachnospiraceae bacterium]|nr:4-hydroxy-tetrahydrodipicolinate synthase [Lachnospiraceae bacterium]
MAIFKGAGVAIVTPMNADCSVNYDKLAELIDYQIDKGTDCIVICGTTGESSTLSEEEHIEVIKAAVSFVKGRIPVVAGTGSNATDTAVYLTKEAEKAGADGALLVTPYYNKTTQKGLKAHYSAIAASTDLPLIVYNVPSRTGVNVEAATMADLFKSCDNIVGIKEASGNITQIADLMDLTNGELELYSGNDDQVIPLLSLGGIGVISVLSNICPADVHELVTSYLAGDHARGLAIQLRAMKLIKALFCEVNPIPVKTAMNLLGYEVGPLRLPLTDMTEQHIELLKAEMKNYGVVR